MVNKCAQVINIDLNLEQRCPVTFAWPDILRNIVKCQRAHFTFVRVLFWYFKLLFP